MSNKKEFIKNLVAVLAALSSIATLVTFSCYSAVWLSVIAIVSLSYAYFMSRKKNSISLFFKNQMCVTVEKGNLFSKKGIIVIPVNDFFDTHVGDGVIARNSVHGKFICSVFKDRELELKDRINKELDSKKPLGELKRRIEGTNNRRFSLGTCININDGGNTYVLFAFTRFDANDKASVEPNEIHGIIQELMRHLQATAEDQPVYMPVFGTRLSRLGKSHQRMLLYTLEILDFTEFPPLTGGLNIELYNGDMNHFDLNAIENYFKDRL